MKRIYTFTLEGDDYPSSKFRENLRIVAHFMYHQILNYGAYATPLNVNKNIRYNRLREGGHSFDIRYFLDSDYYDDGLINYEPFIIGENSFGLSVDDGMISQDTICDLLNYVLGLLNLKYKVTINSMSYESKDIDDESKRSRAIKKLLKKLGCKVNKNTSLVRMLTFGNRYRREKANFY